MKETISTETKSLGRYLQITSGSIITIFINNGLIESDGDDEDEKKSTIYFTSTLKIEKKNKKHDIMILLTAAWAKVVVGGK